MNDFSVVTPILIGFGIVSLPSLVGLGVRQLINIFNKI